MSVSAPINRTFNCMHSGVFSIFTVAGGAYFLDNEADKLISDKRGNYTLVFLLLEQRSLRDISCCQHQEVRWYRSGGKRERLL